MTISAGDLRHSIVINARTDSRDSDYGSFDESYAEHCTCRAAVKHLPGSEVIQADTVANTTAAVFTIRYRSSVNEKMQIVYDGSTWDIKAIEADPGKRWMKLTAGKILN